MRSYGLALKRFVSSKFACVCVCIRMYVLVYMCVCSSPVFPSGDFLANEAKCGRLRENLLLQPRNMPATPTPARNSIRKKRLDRFHRKYLTCVRWNICRAPYAFDDRFPLLTRTIFPEACALLVSKILHNAKVTQKVTSPT